MNEVLSATCTGVLMPLLMLTSDKSSRICVWIPRSAYLLRICYWCCSHFFGLPDCDTEFYCCILLAQGTSPVGIAPSDPSKAFYCIHLQLCKLEKTNQVPNALQSQSLGARGFSLKHELHLYILIETVRKVYMTCPSVYIINNLEIFLYIYVCIIYN